MSNVARILNELVSLEAWHKPHEIEVTSPFYVALNFSEARMSGGVNGDISFRVALKRATLVVVCDENLHVPSGSKLREYPEREWTRKTTETYSEEDSYSMGQSSKATGRASTTGGAATGERATAREENARQGSDQGTEVTETMRNRVHMTYRSVGNEHHWDCTAMVGENLSGLALNGADPIMETRPSSNARLDMLGIRVFVKCKAEDFDIPPDDIQASKTLMEKLTGERLERRLRLAREVIKAKLAAAELEIVELEPRFQDVIIADLFALPEV